MVMKGEFYFLSNMFPCDIIFDYDGRTYHCHSVESAFQGMKDPSRLSEFEPLNAYQAKRLGRRVRINVEEWNKRRDAVMWRFLNIKFSDPKLLERLLKVEGEIAEDNTWNDTYWGRVNGIGENHLGKMLMRIRDNERTKRDAQIQ